MSQTQKNKFLKSIYHRENQISNSSIRFFPLWIVMGFDVVIIVFSFFSAHLFIDTLGLQHYTTLNFIEQLLIIFLANSIFFFGFRTYSASIMYFTIADISKLILAAFVTFLVLLLFNEVYFFFANKKIFLIPFLVLYGLFSFMLLLFSRLFFKQLFFTFQGKTSEEDLKKRLFIYGIDDQSISIAKGLLREIPSPFEVVGFLSQDKSNKIKRILDKPVITLKRNLKGQIQSYAIRGLVFVEDSISVKEKNKLVDDCLKANVQTYLVPSVDNLKENKTISSQIRCLEIEDLLNRKGIQIETDTIRSNIEAQSILITGGAGSIGSEIVRQIIQCNPKQIVILDQAETALYDLELQLKEAHPNITIETELANISNLYRLTLIFEKYNFDLIYHAAAYKHVPIIEKNPLEAIYVNILGTINLVKLAVSYQVKRFVMVSTDKAVNPTNIMGASKRAAEIYVQSIQQEKGVETKFITTRFGNVLGSNGSVIPHFKRQIKSGGPVTVTHSDVSRYFMTLTDACQLVLQAGSMGNGGEIFVFDMGKPIRIMDLATKMIRLYGLQIETDIKIEVIGLRPGEKLFEELFSDSSINLPTHHKKIMIVTDKPKPFKELEPKYERIVKLSMAEKELEVIKLLKEIVPEFKSKNSVFESLDA